MFKQSKKFYDYYWQDLEAVILYSSEIEKNISEIKKQFKYLVFECGYGCNISMRLLKLFNNSKTNLDLIENIKIYRLNKAL